MEFQASKIEFQSCGLDWKCLPAIFRLTMYHKFSMGEISGDNGGVRSRGTLFNRNHPGKRSRLPPVSRRTGPNNKWLVWMAAPSCWNFHPGASRSRANGNIVFSSISLYPADVRFPSICTNGPSVSPVKHPKFGFYKALKVFPCPMSLFHRLRRIPWFSFSILGRFSCRVVVGYK